MKKRAKVSTKGMSKRMQNYVRRVENLPLIDGITDKAMLNIHETLECYRGLLARYEEIKNDPKAVKRFFKLNRNPLFDITGSKYFHTGLMSQSAMKCEKCDQSRDHFIQRTKALKYIFRDLSKNPNMSLETFIAMVEKYCSTVTLTKDEHRSVTVYGRKHKELTNVKIYKKLGIKVPGLGEWCKNNHVTKAVEKSY